VVGCSAWVVNVNRPYEIWHVGGGATSQRGISLAERRRVRRVRRRVKLRTQVRGYWIPLTYLDWKSRRESGNALQLPTFGQPWQAVEKPIERHLPDIADHKILMYVRGRQATAKFGIGEVDQFAEGGGVIECLRDRIRSQEGYVPSFTLNRRLSRVIDGIRHQLGEGVAKTKTERLSPGAVVRV